MKRIAQKLKTKPLYLALLPVFFVVHITQENFNAIDLILSIKLIARYWLTTAITYMVSYIFTKNHPKASILTLFLMGLFFFFAAVHEFLKTYEIFYFLSRYIFLIPFSVAILVLAFLVANKNSPKIFRFNFFVNILLVVYSLIDLSVIVWKSINSGKSGLGVSAFLQINTARIPDSVLKPDIFLLLFDEYASSKTLEEKYAYKNDLDSFLIGRGFNIQNNSHSNYNFTGFSMASLLNMSYLENFPNPKEATIKDYLDCHRLIKSNRVSSFLGRNGYEIINYSIFDIQDKPSMVRQYFLPLSENVVTGQTMFNHIHSDIGWHFRKGFELPIIRRKYNSIHIKNDSFFISSLKQNLKNISGRARFLYAHFMMPHAPFFFDRNGNRRKNELVFSEEDYNSPKSYLQYLGYANNAIKDLITNIQHQNKNAVIILLSDHGFRPNTTLEFPKDHFSILNAVYLPGAMDKFLYRDISSCNQFRVIFNKLFNQNFPLLKDSSIFIIDK